MFKSMYDTFKYDFMLRTMKQDMTKAVQFSNTFRYIDDLLSVNNEILEIASAIFTCWTWN